MEPGQRILNSDCICATSFWCLAFNPSSRNWENMKMKHWTDTWTSSRWWEWRTRRNLPRSTTRSTWTRRVRAPCSRWSGPSWLTPRPCRTSSPCCTTLSSSPSTTEPPLSTGSFLTELCSKLLSKVKCRKTLMWRPSPSTWRKLLRCTLTFERSNWEVKMMDLLFQARSGRRGYTGQNTGWRTGAG